LASPKRERSEKRESSAGFSISHLPCSPPRTQSEVAELVDHFLRQKSHADSTVYRTVNEYFAYWRSRSILRPTGLQATGQANCPLSRISRDPAITALVSEYLGIPVERIRAQVTIDALIRVAGKSVQIDGYDGAVEFHRDIDCWNWIKVFVYLTDTSEGDGHHEMFQASHLRTPIRLIPIRRYDRAEIISAMPELELTKVCGPAGFTFIENTFAFHRGTAPWKSDRLMLTMTYYDESYPVWLYGDHTYLLGKPVDDNILTGQNS